MSSNIFRSGLKKDCLAWVGASARGIIVLAAVSAASPAQAGDLLTDRHTRFSAEPCIAPQTKSKKELIADAAAVSTPQPAPATDDIAASVAPEKKAAIKELLTLTNMSTNADAIQEMMLSVVRQSINTHLKNRIQNDENLSDIQKKNMLDAASDASDRIINRYRELYQERINLHSLMEQVGYKVYDESFTLAEIKDLVAFYRTPTGQKSMREMPQIMKRSMTLTTSIIQPKVADIIKEISSEEMMRLKKDSAGAQSTGSSAATPASK